MTRRQDASQSDGGPLARELARRIRSEILQQADPGHRLPSEAEMVHRFKHSARTVRAALSILAADELIVRKQGSGTYVADHLPIITGTTGLMFYGDPSRLVQMPYLSEELIGILTEASGPARHLQILMGLRGKPTGDIGDIGRRMDLTLMDSVICLELANPQLLAELGRRMVTVSIDVACYEKGVSSCVVDHEQNLELAVEHLSRLGHRQIALVGNVDVSASDPAGIARIKAYKRALQVRRIPEPPGWIFPIGSANSAVQLIHKWLQTPIPRRPTAMACVDFQWPIAQAAVTAGVEVPAQLSLLGIGGVMSWHSRVVHLENRESRWGPEELRLRTADLEMALTGLRSNTVEPRFAPLRNMVFACVDIPFRSMGCWAMQEVIERLADRAREPEHRSFPGMIRPGNTAAPPLPA